MARRRESRAAAHTPYRRAADPTAAATGDRRARGPIALRRRAGENPPGGTARARGFASKTSPTTPLGYRSNTQPQGSWLPALNPLEATLGITNASFVAQTAEWIPAHLFETLQAAYRHRGFSFVRVLQRCPMYTEDIYLDAVRNPEMIDILEHPDGITLPESLQKIYTNRIRHDPRNISAARDMAADESRVRLGVLFRDESRPRYEETRHLPLHTADEKIRILNEELGTEELAAVVETRETGTPAREALRAAIRREVTEATGLGIRYLLLTPPDGVEKTTGGKLSRSGTRDRHLDELLASE